MNITINCLLPIKAHFYDLQNNASPYLTIFTVKLGEMPHLHLKQGRIDILVTIKWVWLFHLLYMYSTENWAVWMENHCCFYFITYNYHKFRNLYKCVYSLSLVIHSNKPEILHVYSWWYIVDGDDDLVTECLSSSHWWSFYVTNSTP